MIYSFLYVIVFSVAAVMIQKMYFSVSPFFSLLITATIATLYFNLVNIGKLKMMYNACWKEKWLWLSIMLTVLVMWNCSMIGPGLIGASLYNFLYFAWLGMLGFVFLSLQDFNKNRIKLYLGVCVLVLLAVIIVIEFHHGFSRNVLMGILLAFIGGTSAFVYFKQSQAILKKVKLSATQILGVRFYLTVIVLFVMLPKGSFDLYFTVKNSLELGLLAFLSLIIPLYFQQKALEKISSEQNAIIMSLCPVSIAFLQELIFKDVTLSYIFIYLSYTSIVVISYFLSKRQIRD